MSNQKILIVEDEAIVAMELELRLKRLGYQVLGPVAHGEAALTEIDQNIPDLVLMDIMLAGKMDGIEAAAFIRERYNIPIIFLTAYSDDKTLERAKATEPYGYLLKPFEESELRITITVALNKHRMDKKLQESEAKHRLVLENINDIVYRVSMTENPVAGRVEFVSGSTVSITGLPPEDFLRDTALWVRLVHPDDREPLFETTRKLLQLREAGTREYRFARKQTGEYRWIEDRIVPQINKQGTLIGYFGVARDITERKRAEQALQQSYDTQVIISELLRLSLTNLSLPEILQLAVELILSITWLSFQSKGCIFLADARGDLAMTGHKNIPAPIQELCSRVPSGKCLCGLAASTREIIFTDRIDDRHEIVHKADVDHGHYCVPVLNKQKLLGVLNIHLRPGHAWNEIEVRFLNAVASALAGIIERRNAEDERENLIKGLEKAFDVIARSKKEWEETFDSINDPIYITDENHTIIKANSAFAAYLGLEWKDVINQKCYVLVHGRSTPGEDCPHLVSLREQKPFQGELTDRKTGQVFQISAFPFRLSEKDKVCSIVIMKNVTGERDKEMRLIMSERLASLGQMAAGIAHEINNPLAAIAGSAEGLLNRVNQSRYDPVLFTNYLKIIEEEIARCKKITTSMLSFVRPGTAEQKAVDMQELLDSTLELIGFQGRLKDVQVLRDYHHGQSSITGSRDELKQVLLSIMSNALDSMQDRGTLTFRTGLNEQGMYFEISDTGPGIPVEHQHRIFDPFFTTKSEKGGTGLGLAIAKNIIAGHKGDIRFSSEPGNGTTFTITLPRT